MQEQSVYRYPETVTPSPLTCAVSNNISTSGSAFASTQLENEHVKVQRTVIRVWFSGLVRMNAQSRE